MVQTVSSTHRSGRQTRSVSLCQPVQATRRCTDARRKGFSDRIYPHGFAYALMTRRSNRKPGYPDGSALIAAILFTAVSLAGCGGDSRRRLDQEGAPSARDALGTAGAGGSAGSGGAGGRLSARDGGGEAGVARPPTLTGVASTWVDDLTLAYCNWAVECGQFPDVATCKGWRGPQFSDVEFNTAWAAAAAVSKGNALYDAVEANACLAELSRLSCDRGFLDPPTIPAPCAAAFTGKLSDGDSCSNDVEFPCLRCTAAPTLIAHPDNTAQASCRWGPDSGYMGSAGTSFYLEPSSTTTMEVRSHARLGSTAEATT
jgi:hypothetical protein